MRTTNRIIYCTIWKEKNNCKGCLTEYRRKKEKRITNEIEQYHTVISTKKKMRRENKLQEILPLNTSKTK